MLRLFGETRFALERSRPQPEAVTDVATILKMAGGPLPPEERRKCPHCDAVLSRRATRCVWCGKKLDDQNLVQGE